MDARDNVSSLEDQHWENHTMTMTGTRDKKLRIQSTSVTVCNKAGYLSN